MHKSPNPAPAVDRGEMSATGALMCAARPAYTRFGELRTHPGGPGPDATATANWPARPNRHGPLRRL